MPRRASSELMAMETYYYGHQSILTVTHFTLTCDLDCQSPASCFHDLNTQESKVKSHLVQQIELKQDGRTRPIAFFFPSTRSEITLTATYLGIYDMRRFFNELRPWEFF